MENINWGCPPKLSPTDRRRIVFSVTADRTNNAVKPPTSSSTPPYPHLSLPSLWYAEVCIYEGYSQEDEAPLSYQKVNGEWHGKVVLTWCTQHFFHVFQVLCVFCVPSVVLLTNTKFPFLLNNAMWQVQTQTQDSNPLSVQQSTTSQHSHNLLPATITTVNLHTSNSPFLTSLPLLPPQGQSQPGK